MIIGTAGHIDHGKTALVRALTGVDTDRLKEEKVRGISIELGYAYQPLENGEVLGFVDVPGHERFIHTMLAGASGIDFALLVVAVDDGVMPQTREHFDILNLLGVSRGAVALTKIDRAETTRIEAVAAELRVLLAGTPLAEAPLFPVASTTGAGVDALRLHLQAQARAMRARMASGGFRLAVDRSFSLKGVGTVVTGSVFAGQVRVGDSLTISPAGEQVRLRGLHVMNRPAEAGSAGQRCALNLAGVDKDRVARGDWLVAPALHAPTLRLDARLSLLSHAPALRHWSPVHLHLGAEHVMVRVALLDVDALPPGGSALVQLVCEQPIGALWGDRFILRDAQARHTLGGGRVLDPWGPPRKRKTAERLAMLAALEAEDVCERLARALDAASSGLDLARLAVAWNCPDLVDLLPIGARRVGTALAYAGPVWEGLRSTLLDGLAQFHVRFPDELGPEAGRARRMSLPQLPAPAFAALVADLCDVGRIRRSGPWLHRPEHRIALTEAERGLFERIQPWLRETSFDPPWVRELAMRTGVEEMAMRRLLLKLARLGEVYQVVKDLFYLHAAIVRLAVTVRELARVAGEARAADFRDRTGIGRKRVIQILEFFDRVGYTRRVGEAHRLRNEAMFDH